MKVFTKKNALLAAAVTLASATTASAQAQNIGDLADTLGGSFASIVELFLGGAFMVGIIFAVMGIMRLKAAADSQGQQVKYSEGLWRLGVAAALMGVPAIITIISGSSGLDGGSTQGLIDSMNTMGGFGTTN